ncbi:Fic family protein [Rhodococcus fascians]|nr:Fic family protein [Rhodococcus fascians]
MVWYLTVNELIAINSRQDSGVEVHDLGGIEVNAARLSPASAYLDGIANTQYFHDGNKRTAWLAANIFLRLNGANVPRVPDIEAEIFVQAVAQNVLDTDSRP